MVDASEITQVSSEVLLKPEGELVTGPKLGVHVLVVPSVPGVAVEVVGTDVEMSLTFNVGETIEVDVVACKGTTGDGDVVSWSE